MKIEDFLIDRSNIRMNIKTLLQILFSYGIQTCTWATFWLIYLHAWNKSKWFPTANKRIHLDLSSANK